MPKEIGFADEFVSRFRELGPGQSRLVEDSVRALALADDPTLLAHHLVRKTYFCNWSHRVRSNLIVVFRVSKKRLIFTSTGTHSQAYRPSA